ncbi:hypothetical protein DL96DRAFT_1828435 [Flagelloscypha sp. PMI_526]|nr:hypothetical protein DL96DRAFT_1828435 [Flagelloscypha sp. PMI_526]
MSSTTQPLNPHSDNAILEQNALPRETPSSDGESFFDMPNPFEVLDNGESVMASPEDSIDWNNSEPSDWASMCTWRLSSPSEMDYVPISPAFPLNTDIGAGPTGSNTLGLYTAPMGDAIMDWVFMERGRNSSPPFVNYRSLMEALRNIQDHPQSTAAFSVETNNEHNVPLRNPSTPMDCNCLDCAGDNFSCDSVKLPGLKLLLACIPCIASKKMCGFVADESASIQTSVPLSVNPVLSTLRGNSMALRAALNETNHFVDTSQLAIDHAEKLFQAWVSDLEWIYSHIDDLYLINYAFNEYRDMLEEKLADSVSYLE